MTKDSPLVTVGIPFYNAEKTLADAIRSVFAQTLTDWELILLDDGSTDGSLDVARSIDDPRVRVVSDGRNLGLSARLNQIAGLANGKYLARMDADDLMHHDRLAAQVEFLERNPMVDVVGTGMYILDVDGRPVAKRPVSSAPFSARHVFAGDCLMHATVMGRTAWFRRNAYDPTFRRTQDFELWCRTFDKSRFARIPVCHYFCTEQTSFALSKYAASAWSVARALWKHGPRHIGIPVCCVKTLTLAGKLLVYAAAVALRRQDFLVARRSAGLTDCEVEQVSSELELVRATALPLRPHTAKAASTSMTPFGASSSCLR